MVANAHLVLNSMPDLKVNKIDKYFSFLNFVKCLHATSKVLPQYGQIFTQRGLICVVPTDDDDFC